MRQELLNLLLALPNHLQNVLFLAQNSSPAVTPLTLATTRYLIPDKTIRFVLHCLRLFSPLPVNLVPLFLLSHHLSSSYIVTYYLNVLISTIPSIQYNTALSSIAFLLVHPIISVPTGSSPIILTLLSSLSHCHQSPFNLGYMFFIICGEIKPASCLKGIVKWYGHQG